MISGATEKLKELGLLSEYEGNQLTILRLCYFLDIPFSSVEKRLYKKGYPRAISYTTLVEPEWLPAILRFKSPKKRVVAIKKAKNKKPRKGLKTKKAIPIRNWLNKKVGSKDNVELKDNGIKAQRPIFISTPMGGKVKRSS